MDNHIFLEHSLSTFFDKTVLVTGHTGFKGSWLVSWLNLLGAKVVGLSLDPPTMPSHYSAIASQINIKDHRVDIRDYKSVSDLVSKVQPDYLFHLAAQPLVRMAYNDPISTWETNLLGTINILESLKSVSKKCTAIFITSDKCYDNIEWIYGYRENDRLGGPDPYSASKASAEIAISSYVKSYFPSDGYIRVASARAGNVIGGGDWAVDRIVPDCVRAWSQENIVEIRRPNATRPWQHVLEPLSGYLHLATLLDSNPLLHGESFNFGPNLSSNHSVADLVEEMAKYWELVKWKDTSNFDDGPYESTLLKLNCDKALHYLGWYSTLNFHETVSFTAKWYSSFYNDNYDIHGFTVKQIHDYYCIANMKGVKWAL
jgi:CDP-glucose 4,6-dehydratase